MVAADPAVYYGEMDLALMDRVAERLRSDPRPTWTDVEILARMFSRVVVDTETGCWLWVGLRTAQGYGFLRAGGRTQAVHRVSYTLLVGPIPMNLTIDHLCRTRCCLNPDHLEVVTLEENVRRGWKANRDRPSREREKVCCPRGHLYSEENTYLDKRGWRKCRTCIRERQARRRLVEGEKIRAIKKRSYDRFRGAQGRAVGVPSAERTHCPQGHPYSEANTYRTPKGDRQCRICKREAGRRWREKNGPTVPPARP